MADGMRVQTGIAHFDDGWRVIQRYTMPSGEIEVVAYDPLFPTEVEADDAAKRAVQVLRVTAAAQGATWAPHVEENGQ